VRAALESRRELALLDLRPEHEHAQGHPLFAASLPFDRLELEVLDRVPNLGAPVVLLDGGEGTAALAERQLGDLGYRRVSVLDGGVAAWSHAGYELFGDVNAPSKAFGELVASRLRVPFIAPDRLQRLVTDGGDVAVVDVRRYEEYAEGGPDKFGRLTIRWTNLTTPLSVGRPRGSPGRSRWRSRRST
jgi:rhodanese-related sulfurtransferase